MKNLKNISKKDIIIIISICALVLIVLGGTIAYYNISILNSNNSTITNGLDYYINYTKGSQPLNPELNTSGTYKGGTSTSIELWKENDTYDIYGHMYLNVSNISDTLSNSGAFKYAVAKQDETVISEGVITNSSEPILIASNIPLETSQQLYTVYLWIDSSIITGELGLEKISISIKCEATMKPLGE